MREDIRDIIDIDNLKDGIRRELETVTAVEDFAVLTFFLGNDFLHRIWPATPGASRRPRPSARA